MASFNEVAKVTYNKDAKPLLVIFGAPCHATGGTNPNKQDDFITAKNKISVLIDRVERDPSATGFMPEGSIKLSTVSITTLKQWVADGMLGNQVFEVIVNELIKKSAANFCS